MQKISFDLSGLLMLFGMYFLIKYIQIKNLLDLIYGILVIIYSIRFKLLEVKR